MLSLLLATSTALAAQSGVTISVETGANGFPIPKTLFGAFFEDINFGADGGISAELIKNGSFEFYDGMTGWRKLEWGNAAGGFGIQATGSPYPKNPHFLRLAVEAPGDGVGIENEGYRGMGFRAGETYHFSAMARVPNGASQTLVLQLVGSRGAVLGEGTVNVNQKGWAPVSFDLTAKQSEARGGLRIIAKQVGSVDLEAVSLMPKSTWKGRSNGLRTDIVQLLADMKPGFIRFPGGCIVEGRDLSNRYQWKETIGPVENRKVIYNRWNVEFAGSNKGAYDYYQSGRLGFFEYFQLCDDIGAEPVPILNCGMACQYNSGELAPLNQLDTYVKDALDLIDFANGPTTSKWGKVRAQMGHPAPFGLKKIGVGNEQWGPQYYERYQVFAKALRAKHPEIQLVASAGPSMDNDRYHSAWNFLSTERADIIDEHCYSNPTWFLDNAFRYDKYPRNRPKVFMGEYAAHVGDRRNTWEAAIAEAAFMTGLERNSDIVEMSSYAPLFARSEAVQWAPDLIWFNSQAVYGTPDYYVQKLFSNYTKGTELPVTVSSAPLASNAIPRLYASASKTKEELILKLVNATDVDQEVGVQLGAIDLTGEGTVIEMKSPLATDNTFDAPSRVAPKEQPFRPGGRSFKQKLSAQSFVILRIPIRG